MLLTYKALNINIYPVIMKMIFAFKLLFNKNLLYFFLKLKISLVRFHEGVLSFFILYHINLKSFSCYLVYESILGLIF